MSTITEDDKKFVETWENVGPATTGILRLDSRGDVKHEMIQGPRNFIITTEERMITQDRIASKELDPFLNGTFRPVVVPDSVTIESNPNALSDEEITKILEASAVAWQEWLKNLDSVATLRRMMEVAERSENFSLARYRELEARLTEVRPQQRLTTNDPALLDFLDPDKRKSPAAAEKRRSQGGRSSDYRDS